MQQDSSSHLLTVADNNKNTKTTNHLKIAMVIISIIALCGIVFGVYCAIQNSHKNERISDLEAQVDSFNDEIAVQQPETSEDDNNSSSAGQDLGLHLIGDLHTRRKYYLGTTSLEPGQDTREKEIYIIDSTKLGSQGGIKKYDLKPILDKAISDKVATLPDTLAAGTTNATPKSNCQSYKVVAGDPTNLPGTIDWTIATDWDDKLPLTLYFACMMDSGGELSLGTGLYSLDPNTNDLVQLIDTSY